MDLSGRHRAILERVAHRAMTERGLLPEFDAKVAAELARIDAPAKDSGLKDLRAQPWCSIDNDDSRDLDQLSVGAEGKDGGIRIQVAVADVDALVHKGGAIDGHAHANTTSVYTPARIFPMLPEKLSTDLTSLNPGQDRVAMVVGLTVDRDGSVRDPEVGRALVHNHAKLAYNSVASWLDGQDPAPAPLVKVQGLEANLRLQDQAADRLRERRHEEGALDLETIEARAVFDGDSVSDLEVQRRNQARFLIEDFMIAVNGVVARFLAHSGQASLRRVVRSPERWARIVDLAAEHHEKLPAEPDSAALEAFLTRRRRADPLRFPDLSLTVIKLMGKGEYIVESPGRAPTGHFGLAVRDYAHSTAPNRRYPDLVTQRLVKAVLAGGQPPYARSELEALATHCTEREDAANKVERLVRKAAAACLLGGRIGEQFDAIVTGASEKGTWVRIFRPPVEGKLVHGAEGLDVGDKVRVKLVDTDVERGFIDFVRAGR